MLETLWIMDILLMWLAACRTEDFVTRKSSGKARIKGEKARIATLFKHFSIELLAKPGIFRSRKHKSDRLLEKLISGSKHMAKDKEVDLKKELKDIPFEQALEELEKLVDDMEQGEMPLDKMISYFERGTALAKVCRHKLSKLEKKIEVLVKDNGAEGEWEEFDDSSERKDAASGTADGEFSF
jgi:exodeoxyribonuclease VII small subunit